MTRPVGPRMPLHVFTAPAPLELSTTTGPSEKGSESLKVGVKFGKVTKELKSSTTASVTVVAVVFVMVSVHSILATSWPGVTGLSAPTLLPTLVTCTPTASSFRIVPVAGAGRLMPLGEALLSTTRNVSSLSGIKSPLTTTLRDILVVPTGNVMVPVAAT